MEDARPLSELVAYRERENLSRAELADKFGVSRETIFRWETGQRRPDKAFIPQISKLTGVPILELMGLDGEAA